MLEPLSPFNMRPYSISACLGFLVTLTGFLSHINAISSLGILLMGTSIAAGNVITLRKGAVLSLQPGNSGPIYAKEEPVLFIFWFALSFVGSVVLAAAGLGGLVRWLHG